VRGLTGAVCLFMREVWILNGSEPAVVEEVSLLRLPIFADLTLSFARGVQFQVAPVDEVNEQLGVSETAEDLEVDEFAEKIDETELDVGLGRVSVVEVVTDVNDELGRVSFGMAKSNCLEVFQLNLLAQLEHFAILPHQRSHKSKVIHTHLCHNKDSFLEYTVSIKLANLTTKKNFFLVLRLSFRIKLNNLIDERVFEFN
jgi:hypothetical protein